MRKELRGAARGEADAALVAALDAVRALDIPHLEPEDIDLEDPVVH